MTVAVDTTGLSESLRDCLPQCDADVFDRVVGINIEITAGLNVEINQSMASYLLEHMIKKRQAGLQLAGTGPVEVDRYADLSLAGFAMNFGGTR